MFHSLWTDDAGFVVSAELVLVATILVIGILVGLVTVRDQVVHQLADVAAAVAQFNQSYSFSAITGHTSSVAGIHSTTRSTSARVFLEMTFLTFPHCASPWAGCRQQAKTDAARGR